MSKWCGNVGFANTVEYEPGCWEEQIIERKYYGDIISNRWKRQNSEWINDDINLSNQVSIVADPYAINHCSTIIFVEFMGTKWKVSDVEVQYPRLTLSIGGVYNGNSSGTSS